MEKLNLQIDTGAVEVELQDGGNVIGSFTFVPSDIDLITRFDDVQKAIKEFSIPKKLEEEEIMQITNFVKEQFAYLLNTDISGIFAKCNPLTPLKDGSFYFEKVLDGVATVIEKTMDKRVKTRQAKIDKALKKYK